MAIQKWSDHIWVVQLGEEPILSDDLNGLRERIEQTKPTPNIVLDMAAVKRINSSNLSQLLRVRKVIIDGDARMKLAAIADSVWVVFITTGLDKVFEFAEGVPTALAGLQMQT